MDSLRLVEQLWQEQDLFRELPKRVVRVRAQLPGLAFFPGGLGLWRDALGEGPSDLPVGGIMVLGHDFHSEVGYEASAVRGGESHSQPTWRNLLALFRRAGVPLERCFFTNFYMGLREGKATTGVFPGATDSNFVAFCGSFLCRQIEVQRPRLVVSLGLQVPPLLSRMTGGLAAWASARSINTLDTAGALKQNVAFGALAHVTVAALVHPSLRHASIRHRQYDQYCGDEAEVQILRYALRLSRVLGTNS